MTSNRTLDLPTGPVCLTEKRFLAAIEELRQGDRRLAQILSKYGQPPMWAREPGFPTLVQIILEQQVSLASAKAAFGRLLERANPLTPERSLRLDDQTLKEIGFSRQKMGYVRGLAKAIQNGDLDLFALESLDDAAVHTELIKVRGIGPWTADIYLLMALRRPDIWPKGDLALVKAVQDVMELPNHPSGEEMSVIGERWKPYRGVATRIMWHYYLSSKDKRNSAHPQRHRLQCNTIKEDQSESCSR